MATFNAISLHRLVTCHVKLQAVARGVILVQAHLIIEGHRGKAAQDRAVADGKSQKPWPTGNHNALPSTAIDVAPTYYLAGAKIDWGDVIAFGRLAGIYQAVAFQLGVQLRFGLDWDGDFWSVGPDPDESFLDAPHIELLNP